jgi:hypothetical protein
LLLSVCARKSPGLNAPKRFSFPAAQPFSRDNATRQELCFAMERKNIFLHCWQRFCAALVYFLAKKAPAAGCLFFVIMGKLIRRAEVAFQAGRVGQ